MPKCSQCGKVLKNDLAMKIHVGRMHKTGAQQNAKPHSTGSDLTSASTSALIGELRRRAEAYDRLKALNL